MTDRRALALLVLLHLAMVAIVQPRGDFPLNDDWAFAQSVRWLLDEGRLRLSDWVPMYLIPQTLAGATATTLFGFSFEVLRHVTQAVAVVALFSAFAWFRTVGLEARDALVATAVLAAFPAWPVLANSFMTDLYALAFALPAAAFFVKALDVPVGRMIILATLLSVVGVLQRQVVLALPFAFMVAWLWTRRPLTVRPLAIGIAPLAASLAAVLAFQAYLEAGPGVPEMHRMAHGRVARMALGVLLNEEGLGPWVLSNLTSIIGYLGLFALPWLAWRGLAGAGRAQRVAILAGGVALMAIAFSTGWMPPYRPNQVMDAVGVGPFMLYDTVRGQAPLDRSAGWFWSLAAVFAAFAAATLVVAFGSTVARVVRAGGKANSRLVFLLAVCIAYLGPFIVTDYFDRYLLFVLPFVLALASCAWPASSQGFVGRKFAVAWIIAVLLLGAAATRDYFSWNRARWDAIRMAEKLGGDPDSIDAGFEYGGLRRYEKRPAQGPENKSWYWVKDDRFVVAFSNVPGYDEVATWKVAHWLPRTPAEVKLLKRKP